MFHLVIEPTKREMSEFCVEDNDYTEIFRDLPLDAECVEFSMGNPRVERISGIVHLYKRNTLTTDSAAGSKPSSTATKHSNAQAPDAPDVSRTVCCLAIPADMSVANFCTFIGAYLSEVRAIQVLRREGTQPSICMVLLTFASQDQADSFYSDFNGLPFSSLEPDILCRLVFVRSVEVLSSRGRPAITVPAAAVAKAGAVVAAIAKDASASPDAAAGASDAAATSSGAAEAAAGSTSPQPQNAAVDSTAVDKVGSSNGSISEIEPADEPAADADNSVSAAAGSTASPRSATSSPAESQQTYAAVTSGNATTAANNGVSSGSAGSCASVTVAASAAPCVLWLEPPSGTTELPTCPVCLERLDEHISGIVTTVCNHRFHGECLKRWGDTSCPVCRYCMYSSNTSTSRCSVCGTNANLWICLICGHVGCGRYKQGHASDHWQESAHCYALELETQRVWDYAGDGYVHRLIQSKTDGKLVEVPSPAPTCSHGSPAQHHHHHRHHRHAHAAHQLNRTNSECSGAAAGRGSASCGAGADSDSCGSSSCPVCTDEQQQMKDAMVSSKLDAITLEYNYLLTTQLDSQRQYFESLLAQQEAKQRDALAAAQAAAEKEAAARQAALAAAKESERKRQQLEKKLAELNSAVTKASDEREFLRSLNETLLANQKDFGAKLKSAQAALVDKDAQLQDLQEQVRDLMVFIEAQRTIASSGSELQDATLLPVPAKESTGRRRRK